MSEFERYHRQMLLPGFGKQGQRKLSESTALILGCGALGSVAADTLARAGVGHLVIVDRDFVELTNLQRQVLFDESDVADAIPKAEAARRKIARINSDIRVTAIVDDIDHSNIGTLASQADIMVDGLDNFETRYLANECSVKYGIPYIYGGAVGTSGMACVFLPPSGTDDSEPATERRASENGPCFKCIFEEPPAPGQVPTCDTVGVIGPVVSIIASFQAAEVLKVLTGQWDRVNRHLLNIDLWDNSIVQLDVTGSWNSRCSCCVDHVFEYLEGKTGSRSTTLCGRDAVQLTHRRQGGQLNLDEISKRLAEHGPVMVNEFMVRARLTDQGNDFELTLFADGRAIVKGTDVASTARGVYAKYVGN